VSEARVAGLCLRLAALLLDHNNKGLGGSMAYIEGRTVHDAGFEAFRRGEARLQKLSMRPSDYAKRQFRVTPYSHEPTVWILNNSDPKMLLFSSDFPRVEGGRNPVKCFEDQLTGVSDLSLRRLYRDNFIDLMGAGLHSTLQDHPSLTSH